MEYGPGLKMSKRSWSNHRENTDCRAEFGMHGHAMPKADDILIHADYSFCPIMFAFATEGCDLKYIAREQGFDIKVVEMESSLPDDDPFYIAYFENGETFDARRWTPPTFSEWDLVGMWETDDGPIAVYVRPIKSDSDRSQAPSGG